MSTETPTSGNGPTWPSDTANVSAGVEMQNVEPVRYTRQLVAIYTVLAVAVGGALVGLVFLVIQPGKTTGPSWSDWKPKSSSVGNMTKSISDQIAAKYRLSEDGGQLVAIIPTGATITSGTANVPVKAIAVRKVPQSNTGIRILDDTSTTRLYTLCGLGKNCSIEGGKASATRGRLVRREALEAALYTFKFVPSVNSVIAFMPPAPGATTTSVLFLEKSALKEQLSKPISKTLPLATPPLPGSEDLAEAATIDKLTLKNMFSYELTALQTGGAALILDPAT
jgi:hypothetical protein